MANSQPWVLCEDGKAELRNVTMSADSGMHVNSACTRLVSTLREFTEIPKSHQLQHPHPRPHPHTHLRPALVPVGLNLGICAQVTVDESRLACAVTSSTTQNYLVYTSSTSFHPYDESRSLADSTDPSKLQADVCAARERCEEGFEGTQGQTELEYTACRDGWTRTLRGGQFCLKDICVVVPECSATYEGEWLCADGSKRGFDRQTEKFCTINAAESLSLALVRQIVGGFIGLLMVALVGRTLVFLYRNPHRFQALLTSLMQNEVRVGVGLGFELLDFAGGTVAFFQFFQHQE